VNIFAKADGLQNQAQPLEDFARRLKPKTFDQLVSNCADNVHLEVNDYLTTFLYKFGRNEKQNNPFHRASLAQIKIKPVFENTPELPRSRPGKRWMCCHRGVEELIGVARR
ncbi:hypothetical protein HID58_029040, partial [Brassica napus]